ncbi:MAG: hypothetical protein K5873_06235 [Treponema sp.]|nr:hypothetical protein [Treponema sp.]
MVKTSFYMGFDKTNSYSQNLGRQVIHPEDLTVLMTSCNYLGASGLLVSPAKDDEKIFHQASCLSHQAERKLYTKFC